MQSYLPHPSGLFFNDPLEELAAEPPVFSFSPQDTPLPHTNQNFDNVYAPSAQQSLEVMLIPSHCFVVCL